MFPSSFKRSSCARSAAVEPGHRVSQMRSGDSSHFRNEDISFSIPNLLNQCLCSPGHNVRSSRFACQLFAGTMCDEHRAGGGVARGLAGLSP